MVAAVACTFVACTREGIAGHLESLGRCRLLPDEAEVAVVASAFGVAAALTWARASAVVFEKEVD